MKYIEKQVFDPKIFGKKLIITQPSQPQPFYLKFSIMHNQHKTKGLQFIQKSIQPHRSSSNIQTPSITTQPSHHQQPQYKNSIPNIPQPQKKNSKKFGANIFMRNKFIEIAHIFLHTKTIRILSLYNNKQKIDQSESNNQKQNSHSPNPIKEICKTINSQLSINSILFQSCLVRRSE
ncbi:hypothetical protein TTHERM_00252330 (macronuclear) [Tetrahymena thermophila SB210]|uniref:Uncharacterized protein n=1 Tax=Tetrahymena thermophila (strain SB210) TaxID=312017 RepID=Q23QP9_TETTS|nr:hypothetical protein TTHERM_00252330 [Tetrahymena thermophila SB210]EAR98839.1 hypothetical protein TTHERM_00252330 [Tetrahymena thermophila SB210]|eukprot:XP_001019084.1 hypothetical protein TTHERM_00252330 [Tetrahymena thermophila SB210]